MTQPDTTKGTASDLLRAECCGLDRLYRASLGGLLLAMDEATGELRERIEWAIAGYGR